MKTYKELKKYCEDWEEKHPGIVDKKKLRKELILAKRYYDNGINLDEYLSENAKNVSCRYCIPFILGITKKIVDKGWEYKFVREGSSGGADVDMDFDEEGREKIKEYLKKKFGENRVLSVGTFSRLGPASAAKDLLRIYKIGFKQSNEFTKVLNKEMTWKENIAFIRENYPEQFGFYEKHKNILDMTPHFINKIRQSSKHAGGVVITDKPFHELIPVDRVRGEIITAFPESNQNQVLDELGICKFDLLVISVLDIIKNSINMVKEKLFLVEENGIKKVVPESYINERIEQF